MLKKLSKYRTRAWKSIWVMQPWISRTPDDRDEICNRSCCSWTRNCWRHALIWYYYTSALYKLLLLQNWCKGQARNPYIQVLIDGDGMIFNSDLIRQGVEGGKQAAALLRNKVLELCPSSDIEIIANVYTNLHGLSSALLRDGSTDDMEQFKNFTVGFTQGKASFNFIDVGHGKERADSKIKEVARWHLRNQNCKQILLGISHDAGYAPFLDEVVGTTAHTFFYFMMAPFLGRVCDLKLQTAGDTRRRSLSIWLAGGLVSSPSSRESRTPLNILALNHIFMMPNYTLFLFITLDSRKPANIAPD